MLKKLSGMLALALVAMSIFTMVSTPASAASWGAASAFGFTIDTDDYTSLWTTVPVPAYVYAYDRSSGDLAGCATINWFFAKQKQQTNGYDINAMMFHVTMTPQANFSSQCGSLGTKTVTGASDDFEITVPFSSPQLYQLSYPKANPGSSTYTFGANAGTSGAGISASTSISTSNLDILDKSKTSGNGNKFQLCYDYKATPGGNAIGNTYLMTSTDQRAVVYYATDGTGHGLNLTFRVRFGSLWGIMSYSDVAETTATWGFGTLYAP